MAHIRSTTLALRYFAKRNLGWRNFTQIRGLRLAEVGRLGGAHDDKKPYETGQFFLHRLFGYRGVVLFRWSANVFDRDEDSTEKDAGMNMYNESMQMPKKNVKSQTCFYYQALVDSRDSPLVRAQAEPVTFLGEQEGSMSIYAIPGLDYAGHTDIIPFTSTEKFPLKHELFKKFLKHSPNSTPPYVAHDALRGWENKNHPWLELSTVHRQTTEKIRVTVIPFYMGARFNQSNNVYWWRYCIRIENMGTSAVILRERHWRIFSLSGTLETVRGRGVVGQEPVLTRGSPVFQYSSHVNLNSPNGHMWGSFRMERQDGYTFDVKVPPFSLDSKADQKL